MIGAEIGTYKILEKIGQGGMGVVYRGVDTGLDRPVAIKVLNPDLAHDPELVQRFQSEARAQANLNHPNIATLYAFLQFQGQCLIVMEFLQGETFEQLLLDRGKIPWKGAVSLTRQSLQGLGFAHDKGIVHRDIKPGNLMLTSGGIVKVMDFGIAKALANTVHTGTGVRIGTARYMSPEQIRGQQVDARSDIYSLGITLYQLLTGDIPFHADSDFDLMSAHVNTPPPVFTNQHKDIPKGIEACVMKTLAKDPSGRFQSAEEFGSALEMAAASSAEVERRREKNVDRGVLVPGAGSGKQIRPELVAAMVGAGLVLYAVSFFMHAVGIGGESASLLGWSCAYDSLIFPWSGELSLFADHRLTNPRALLFTLSILFSGWINPVFLLAMVFKLRSRLRRASTILIRALWPMFPCCWVVFGMSRIYPLEGYVLWMIAMLVALFPGYAVRSLQRITGLGKP